MLRKFLKAISRDWGSLVTGAASIPITILAFWANTPLQRTAWAIFAITCLLVALFRIWAFEYRRAEAAETKLSMSPRPWLTIDCYSAEVVEDEMDREYLWEKLHIVNRGQAPAVNIVIPEIQLAGRRTLLFRPLPTLGPSESVDAVMSNFRETLDRGFSMMPPSAGQPRTLRIPLVLEYYDLDHKRWTTEHAISLSVFGIRVEVVHPNEPQEWSNLSSLSVRVGKAELNGH